MKRKELMSKNKPVVVITGGTSGIGLATAARFLSMGRVVALVGRDKKRAMDALHKLRDADRYHLDSVVGTYPADIRSATQCAQLTRAIAGDFGRIDVLINAAGIYVEGAAEDLTEAMYEDVMDTNVRGTMFMTKYALPYLRESKGCIVNVSSDAGLHANFGASLYCASKGAVTLYTRAVAREMAPYGVRVNCVCPADVMTPLTEKQLAAAPDREAALREMASVYPLGRIATADEVAALIVYLASADAAFVTGAAWNIDGGLLA